MKFSIRDLMWLAAVVGLAVLWLSERNKASNLLQQRELRVDIGGAMYDLEPGHSIEVRRHSNGGFHVIEH